MATQRPQTRALAASRRRGAALGVGVGVRVDVAPVDTWRLVADIPAEGLVSVRRRGGSRLVKMSIGIPALHNMHDRSRAHAVKKIQQSAFDAEYLRNRRRFLVLHGGTLLWRFDVLIIRRAPRPLDAAVQEGDWKKGGRRLYGDNAESSAKVARDWMFKRIFGLDDDSSPLVRCHVGQEYLAKAHQIEVLIKPAAGNWYELPDRWLRGEL